MKVQEIEEKDQEIKILTQTIRELKSRVIKQHKRQELLTGLDDMTLPISEREKFEALLSENRFLKEENELLRKRNLWLTKRLMEQSNILKIGVERKIESIKSKKKDSNQKNLSGAMMKWYYNLSDQMEKMTVSSFKNMTKPTFGESLNQILRDFLFVLPAQKYMYTVVLDEKMSDIFEKAKNKTGSNRSSITWSYPDKFGSEVNARVRKFVNSLESFREAYLDE